MHYICDLSVLVTTYFLSTHAIAASTIDNGEESGTSKNTNIETQHNDTAAGKIEKFIPGSTEPEKILIEESLTIIDKLLSNRSFDQDLIYEFVRVVNRNMDRLDENCKIECGKLVDRIRKRNRELLDASYSDVLHQNANLSNQLRTRSANLISDSLKISGSNQYLQDDFLHEYELITKRFLNSSRFRIGIGVYNTYLPEISFKGGHYVDFSPYGTNDTGGGYNLHFNNEFATEYSANFVISARIPFVEISATFPSLKKENFISSPLVTQDINESEFNLLMKSNIVSTLEFNYEVSANVSIKDLVNSLRKSVRPSQYDIGLGIGAVGIEITDHAFTDVRVETADSSTYDDLGPDDPAERDVIITTHSDSYVIPYISMYYTFKVSDEIHFSVDIKNYLQLGSRDIKVSNDLNMSIKAVWFPTFKWLKKFDDFEKKSE